MQEHLFGDLDKEIESEWEGMPEFIQNGEKPFTQIILRFRSKEDLDDFSRLIGQKLTTRTKSLWHPALVRGVHSKKRYVDES